MSKSEKSKEFKVKDLIGKYSNDFIIDRYQRNNVWGFDLQKQLIIDIYNEKYLPNIVVSHRDNKYYVLDGFQRLSSIKNFALGKLGRILVNDKQLNREDFFKKSIYFDVIEFKSNEDVIKQEITLFEKLNLNKVSLKKAELRRSKFYNHPLMSVLTEDFKDAYSNKWVSEFYNTFSFSELEKSKLKKGCQDEDIVTKVFTFFNYNLNTNIDHIEKMVNKCLENENTNDFVTLRDTLTDIFTKTSMLSDLVSEVKKQRKSDYIYRVLGLVSKLFSEAEISIYRKEIQTIIIEINNKIINEEYPNVDHGAKMKWTYAMPELYERLNNLKNNKVSKRTFQKELIEKKSVSKTGNAQLA